MTMPKKEQFTANFRKVFRRHNPSQEIPEAWLSWLYFAFRQGYDKGREDFMQEHDWYE